MKRTATLSILAMVAFAANAQTPNPRTATITFTAPTQYTDGTPIEAGAVITYYLYQGLQGGAKGKVGAVTSGMVVNQGLMSSNTYCFDVTAVINGGPESAHSNEGCKLIKAGTAVAVVITVT